MIQKKLLFTYAIVLISLIFSSCTSLTKMECDMPKGQIFIKRTVKEDFVKEFALLLADNDYTGSKRGWYLSFPKEYKEYLQEQMDQINAESSPYLTTATETYTDDFFNLSGIITLAYDKEVNKCECEATVYYANSFSKSSIEYSLVTDNEGTLHTKYKYSPNLFEFSDDDSVDKKRFIKNLLKSE